MKSENSKSELIRDYFSSHPNASNKDVATGLASKGVEVSSNLINQVRHDYKHKKVRGVEVSDEEPLLKMKKMADELGIDRVVQLALLLKKLIGEEETAHVNPK